MASQRICTPLVCAPWTREIVKYLHPACVSPPGTREVTPDMHLDVCVPRRPRYLEDPLTRGKNLTHSIRLLRDAAMKYILTGYTMVTML